MRVHLEIKGGGVWPHGIFLFTDINGLNYRHPPKSLFLVSSQWQSKFYRRKTSFTWHENISEHLGLSVHPGNCLFQKPILRMSCSVIIRERNAPSFTFQCSFPIRMALEWKCSHIIVWRIDLIFSMSLQYHLLGLTTLNDYAYHLVIVFYPFHTGSWFLKVDMQLD